MVAHMPGAHQTLQRRYENTLENPTRSSLLLHRRSAHGQMPHSRRKEADLTRPGTTHMYIPPAVARRRGANQPTRINTTDNNRQQTTTNNNMKQNQSDDDGGDRGGAKWK